MKIGGMWENECPHSGMVERWRWEEYCAEELQARVCRKTEQDGITTLARCLICLDVYMCRRHSIFLACIPLNVPICCLHSRWTRAPFSWNPRGGYPLIQDTRRQVPVPEVWHNAKHPHDDEVEQEDPELPIRCANPGWRPDEEDVEEEEDPRRTCQDPQLID
eukprot:2571233-Amphidinium_carterae.3